MHQFKKSKYWFYIKTAVGLSRPVGIPIGILTMLAAIVSVNGFSTEILPTAAIVTLICYYVGFAPNDYFDSKTDQVNSRKGGIQGEVVDAEKKTVAKWVSIASVVAAVTASLFIPRTAALSLLALTALSLMYSAPPIRLKSRPFLDSISNVGMAYFAFAIGVGLTGSGFNQVIPGAFWFSLIWGGGGHALASVIDFEADKKAGIQTIAVEIGRKPALLITQSLVVLALLFETWSFETKIFHLTSLYGMLAILYNPEKQRVQKIAALMSTILLVYGVIWIYLRI